MKSLADNFWTTMVTLFLLLTSFACFTSTFEYKLSPSYDAWGNKYGPNLAFVGLKPDGEDVDYFVRGVVESNARIILIGGREKAENVSAFCGGLADRQLRETPSELRDAIIFQPSQAVPTPIANVTMFIPRRWFRELRVLTGVEPSVLMCYEGENFLQLSYSTPTHNDILPFRQFVKLRLGLTPSMADVDVTLRSVALLLNNKWNNANLLPRMATARLQIESGVEHRRQVFRRACEPALGLNQSCCLWPFFYNHTRGGKNTTIVFHRCVGLAPMSSEPAPSFLDVKLARLLVAGGMTRRLIATPTKVCRESSFRPVRIEGDESRGFRSATLNRLDADECSLFY